MGDPRFDFEPVSSSVTLHNDTCAVRYLIGRGVIETSQQQPVFRKVRAKVKKFFVAAVCLQSYKEKCHLG